MNSSNTLLKAESIHHRFSDDWVLSNIDVAIRPAEIITLIGPNGAGKSTLLRILLGLLAPTQGQVTRKPDLKIGYMPQKIHIDASLPLTVGHFLNLANEQASRHWWPFKKSDVLTEFSRQQQTILEELDLIRLLNQPVQKVSGGEMQRILLARALIQKPDLLVLDEPVQGVDLQGQNEIYSYIDYLRNRDGYGVLMVSHDLHIVMKHSDEVLCLNKHICCSGHPVSVQSSEIYQTMFGQHNNALAVYEHHHDHSNCEHTHGHGHIHTQETPQQTPYNFAIANNTPFKFNTMKPQSGTCCDHSHDANCSHSQNKQGD